MSRAKFFFGILPLTWLAIALLTCRPPSGRLYLWAVMPALWLQLFGGDWFQHPFHLLQGAGLAGIIVVGAILFGLRMTIRSAIISALVMTVVLWSLVIVETRGGSAIRIRGALLAWFLCSLNAALFLLPIPALAGLMGRGFVRLIKSGLARRRITPA